MTTEEKIEAIGAYDFGVYSFPGGYAVADLLDDAEGYYLTTEEPFLGTFGDGHTLPTLDVLLDEVIDYLTMCICVEDGPLADTE